MPSNDTIGSHPANSSDWSDALEIVSRLAAARDATLHDIDAARQETAMLGARQRITAAEAIPQEPIAAIDPEQLAQAVAEIEKASAALRRLEPALEVWLPEEIIHGETRRHRSVWILVGGIWITASLVVAGTAGAIVYLLG
jgi:hypothetical protein